MFTKFMVSFLVFILSFFSIYDLSTDYEYSLFKIDGIDQTDPNEFTYSEMMDKMANDFYAAKKINGDVTAFIDVPNVCYNPVVFTGDQYYLRKGLDKRYALRGTLFFGAYTDGKLNDSAIIYGHHMNDGTMFATLKLYENQEFFRGNEPIKAFDGEYFYFYKPYTSLIVTDGREKAHYGGREGKEREDYYRSLYERSSVKMEDGLEPNFNADMLFLQTCEYVYNNSRLLVGAYCVKKIPYKGVNNGK